MRTHWIRLTDHTMSEIEEIYQMAHRLEAGEYQDSLKGKTVVMFFPNTSIRTRVTFEKGIYLLGGQTILFPSETLDKKEELQDVIGYLNQWADLIIVRHKRIEVLETIVKYAKVPVVNAMTDCNHPCEVLSDLYALKKLIPDITNKHFLFCGEAGNIGFAWKEASSVFGFSLEQCCGKGYEMEGLVVHHEIKEAIKGKDIVCTDPLPAEDLPAFKDCQVTKEIMDLANEGALLNPCPPFYRGEEVSADVMDSSYFVGYEFKKALLYVQQAVILYCMKIN